MKILIITETSKIYNGQIAPKGYTWLILTYKEKGSIFWFNRLTCIYAQTVLIEDLTSEERVMKIFEGMLNEIKRRRRV